jgi:hypothetical protein
MKSAPASLRAGRGEGIGSVFVTGIAAKLTLGSADVINNGQHAAARRALEAQVTMAAPLVAMTLE